MTTTCDVGQGSVTVSSQALTECNDTGPSSPLDPLRVIGSSSYAISISRSQLTIVLANVTAESQTPFSIRESDVIVILEGSNLLRSVGTNTGQALDCSQSNVTVTSMNSGSLEAHGAPKSPGVGVGPGDSCQTISLINITTSASGGTGIGTSWAETTRLMSSLECLVISGSRVHATSQDLGCGIGTGYSSSGGFSRIDSMTICNSTVLTSAGRGSGVGTGLSELAESSSSIGSLLISYSRIEANSTSRGCGIGTGSSNWGGSARIDSMTICNSAILTSAGKGSGIGTCYSELPGSSSSIGSLSISCSRIEANIAGGCSCIGTGYSKSGGSTRMDDLRIWKAIIIARTDLGSGIGVGWSMDEGSNSSIGSLIISASQIEATSKDWGSGIGSGYSGLNGSARIDYMKICNSTCVTSAGQGSGIGAGLSESAGASSSIGSLLISGSQIEADSTDSGPGFGTSSDADGLSEIDGITILNSTVAAHSTRNGPGIGTGSVTGVEISVIHTITISNSSLIVSGASGYAAIGSGTSSSPVGSLHFMSECFIECETEESSAAIQASSILMTGASLFVVADCAPLFGTSPANNGPAVLIIGYRQTTGAESEHISSINGTFLHVGHVNVSDSALGLFRFCVERNGFRYCFNESLGPIRSVLLSTGGEGPYSFPAWIGTISRDLMAFDCRTRFSIDTNYSFVDVLSFPLGQTTCPFTDSAPLEHTAFDISGNDPGLIATFAAAISAPSVESVRRSASDQLRDSTVILTGSVASSVWVVSQTENPGLTVSATPTGNVINTGLAVSRTATGIAENSELTVSRTATGIVEASGLTVSRAATGIVESSRLNPTSSPAALTSVSQAFRDTNVGSLKGGTTNVAVIAGGVTGGLAVASGGLLAFRLITRLKPQQDEGTKLESQPLV